MSKRELEKLGSGGSVVDVDAPRAKRRKETPASPDDKKPDHHTGDATTATKREAEDHDTVDAAQLAAVQEQGLKLWQTVKDAVDKDGRSLSFDFIRLPSKRQYPDYYAKIKKPIALDQIKTHIGAGDYKTLLDVRQDLESCFRNAKRYNVKDSQIFQDAKALHKLVLREYARMTGDTKGAEADHDDEAEDGQGKAGSGDEAAKKKKAPSLTRLLTTRLEKLVAKTDDQGASLSTPFMELPNKKQWAIYYKTITKPMSFEKIFKHLKRKEYHNTAQFAADVELVFSNAMQFNEDHTLIWESALQLKEHFAKLMSDLPAPFALSQYGTKDPPRASNGKIKFKMPAVAAAAANGLAPTVAKATSPSAATNSLILKVPGGHNGATASAQTLSSSSVPSTSKAPTTAENTSTGATFNSQHYPNYAQAAVQPSPTPSQPPQPDPLKSLSVIVAPVGRRLHLDHRDGVRSWALRLGPGERALRINNLQYHRHDDDESSGDEQEDEQEEEETDSDDEDMEEGSTKSKGKGKETTRVKGRRRRGGVRIKDGVKLPPKRAPPEIVVRLDQMELKSAVEDEDEWDVEVPAGTHILELGEKGGPTWKVFVQKVGV
ncbi:Bromodomain-containing protein [Auriscalpium vulgare]|uniref:Bromodomain-containing protein n=1 Tax=Auriscalpium vulgare TaxID=40419 RepID=A0ACB8S255_9AGAM|nr:Bromodomain-containing protein [Auriscalpium vulgare]